MELTTPAGTYLSLYDDLLTAPHALIAGATGSGKSVFLNGLICSALYSFPFEKQLVLIDTKRTELYQYAPAPHTLQYITEPAAAVQALHDMLNLINARCTETARNGAKQSDAAHVYIIIDELGDLIFTSRNAAPLLGRIAMIGRAANVHLICCTQCPNRKTLSAEFAANMPARIALRCDSVIESRQIIGTNDAVNLPQYGQCLYKSPKNRTPELWNVPYISDAEQIEKVNFWVNQINAAPPGPNRTEPKKKRLFSFMRI